MGLGGLVGFLMPRATKRSRKYSSRGPNTRQNQLGIGRNTGAARPSVAQRVPRYGVEVSAMETLQRSGAAFLPDEFGVFKLVVGAGSRLEQRKLLLTSARRPVAELLDGGGLPLFGKPQSYDGVGKCIKGEELFASPERRPVNRRRTCVLWMREQRPVY
ncbi:hypothetical protein BGZ61DRAFT_21866 [Ilyonectria robusta]|uniref:uncharacterized protein n=1 Tax=Ilyonectria robusta TaxID=1079257 RepID=UPI001E8CC147|nr:uncharacterized protein BGZ61DRAFT_21866 [Ilyonectria robusta]KAH8737739.1 hypothetical protein BGZ61DRAFT_21866 [Ilyonectria robusta]